MTVLFVSDVHLCAARPQRVRAFLDLLAGPARGAEALYLLGDVFDEWLGDDDDRPPHPRVEAALRDLVDAGVPTWFMHGNHDFLVGEAFAARTGTAPLADPSVIEVYGERVLVAHGDAMCTRDEEYQAYRAGTRDPRAQREFLARPLAERAAHAAALRARSDARTELAPEDIMDVTPEAVEATMREHRVARLVHGHTHRPAVHRLAVDGAEALRIVLGAWYGEERVLGWYPDGTFRLGTVAEVAPGS